MSDLTEHSKPEHAHHFAHHFKSEVHEFETCKQGMWLFLLQEVLFFSPLFVGFFIFKGLYPHDFHAASKELNWMLGGLNTLILISSSFTMALAVSSAQRGERQKSLIHLIFTILFACGFLIVKFFEYKHKFAEGTLPGSFFTATSLLEEAPRAPLYFTFYFAMTGLHAVHVIIGIGILLWILIRTKRGDFSPKYYTPVELTGLYWHFVDLVWIYLFPLLYLVG